MMDLKVCTACGNCPFVLLNGVYVCQACSEEAMKLREELAKLRSLMRVAYDALAIIMFARLPHQTCTEDCGDVYDHENPRCMPRIAGDAVRQLQREGGATFDIAMGATEAKK